MTNTETLRVSSSTNCQNLAGAIAKVISKGSQAEITAIGAGAVSQAVKGMAIARRMVSTTGYDLMFTVGFSTVNLEDVGGKAEVTAMVFRTILR